MITLVKTPKPLHLMTADELVIAAHRYAAMGRHPAGRDEPAFNALSLHCEREFSRR